MNKHWPKRMKGFSRAEFLFVLTLIALLAGVLLRQLEEMQERAEPVLMETVLISLNGLAMAKFARAYAVDRRDELEGLVDSNPMAWVKEPPLNYGGEIDLERVKWEALPAAHWYFDTGSKTLLYKVATPEQVEITGIPSDQLRFRVRLERNVEGGTGAITGMRIVPARKYEWLRDVALPVPKG